MKRRFWITGHLILFTLFAVACGLCETGLGAAAFEVDGVLDYQYWQKDGSKGYHKSISFTLSTDDCQYRIRGKSDDAQEGSLYVETGCDGSDVYVYYARDLEASKRGGQSWVLSNDKRTGELMVGNSNEEQAPKNVLNDASGEVYAGRVPHFNGQLHEIMWLAYASSCYFRNLTNAFLIPIWAQADPVYFINGAKVKGDWTLLSPISKLPSKVVYYSAGTKEVRVGGRLSKVKEAPPYDQGFTNAVYEVGASTNTDIGRIPLTFSFITYAPIVGGRDASLLQKVAECSGRLTALRMGSRPDRFVPAIMPRTRVGDYRVAQLEGNALTMIYISTTNKWSTVDELKHGPGYEKHKTVLKYTQEKPRRPRIITVAIIAAILVAPAIWFLSFKMRKATGQSKSL